MSKFNRGTVKPTVYSPVTTEFVPSGRTYQGGPGYARDTRSKLFLLAVTNMVGEHTFYESATQHDTRYTELVHRAAVEDPDWTARFLRWLRNDANLRTASLVGAAEFVRARLRVSDGEQPVSNRAVIASVLQRADEPGELLAYWTSVHGRAVPKPVKRGIADAVVRLYDERALLKYDSSAHAFRFADVIELVHPSAATTAQGTLFKYTLDRRHGNDGEVPPELTMLAARAELMARPVEERRALLDDPEALQRAGMTWESLAGWLQGPMDARAWQAVIPTMGYMALLRNLRNFDEAGVPDDVAELVAARLSNTSQVARSRQLPMRYLSAYRAAPSLRWGVALERALTASLSNVPVLHGHTLMLVDTSGSMHSRFSRDGSLMRWDAAAVFGIALASRCAWADVVSFSSKSVAFPLQRGESLLRSVDRWKADGYFLGAGTETAAAIRQHLRPGEHDRVVVLTDEQARDDVAGAVPATTPLYTWNLAGYQYGHAPSGSRNRHTFGGLTDQAFRMIPLIEAGRSANWPF
jgi:hypothetical protein